MFSGGEPATDRSGPRGGRDVCAAADQVAVHVHVLGDAKAARAGNAPAPAVLRHRRHGSAFATHGFYCSQW